MRIGIIGVGAVGEACAHLLASSGIARSLVLANRSVDIANAIRMDLEQSRPWTKPLSARSVPPWSPDEFRGCDALILTAGPRLQGTQTRADMVTATARLLHGSPGQSIVEALTRCAAGPEPPVLLVVTNPVEATVTWLQETTGWKRSRILGLGTTVESARFSRFLSDDLNVDASSVWTEIVGEHGPMIEVRDEAALCRRVRDLSGQDPKVEDLLARTRAVAAEIRKVSEAAGKQRADRFVTQFEAKLGPGVLVPEVAAALRKELAAEVSPPATRFAIAAAALEVIEAVGADRGRLLPVSGLAGFQGLPDVALALPFVVGRAGIVARGLDAPTQLLRGVAVAVERQVQAMRAAV